MEEEHPEGLDRKQLERDRGFAIHAMGAYPTLRPYVKGTHQTLETWRGNQDPEGWRLSQAELDAHNGMTDTVDLDPSDAPPPARVCPIPRLRRDMSALRWLTRAHRPPRRRVRCTRRATIFFGFVDASGVGFGSSLSGTRSALIIDSEVVYRQGDWGPADRKKPSNTKE